MGRWLEVFFSPSHSFNYPTILHAYGITRSYHHILGITSLQKPFVPIKALIQQFLEALWKRRKAVSCLKAQSYTLQEVKGDSPWKQEENVQNLRQHHDSFHHESGNSQGESG